MPSYRTYCQVYILRTIPKSVAIIQILITFVPFFLCLFLAFVDPLVISQGWNATQVDLGVQMQRQQLVATGYSIKALLMGPERVGITS